MRITTAEIKMLIMEMVSDGDVYSVPEIKRNISIKSIKEYSPGQISGCLYQLTETGQLENVGRGLYKKGPKSIELVNPPYSENLARQEQSPFRLQIKGCLQETGQQLEKIVKQTDIWTLNSADFEFLGEIKLLNEQMKKLAEKC